MSDKYLDLTGLSHFKDKMDEEISDALAGYQTKIDSTHKLDYSLLDNTPTFDNVPTSGSDNPVKSGGVYDAIGEVDAKLDDYAKIDGAYEGMLAGNAMNLVDTTGTPILRDFVFSKSGGSEQIATGTALIKRLRGNTIVWNQLVQNGNFADGTNYWTISNASNVSVSGGVLSLNNTSTSAAAALTPSDFSYVSWHIYYIYFKYNFDSQISTNLAASILGFNSATMFTSDGAWHEYKRVGTISSNVYYIRPTSLTGMLLKFSSFNLFDLTQMFGAGNEPTSVEEFESMFPLDYYEYNAGELLSFSGDSVKTVGFNQLNVHRSTEYNTQTDTPLTPYLSENNVIKGYSRNGYVRQATIASYSITNDDVITVSTADISFAAPYGIGFPVKVIGGATYCIKGTRVSQTGSLYMTYLNDGQIVSYEDLSGYVFTSQGKTITIPSNVNWVVITLACANYNTTCSFKDINLNLSDPSKNGTYEPYVVNTKDISFYKSIRDANDNILFPYGLLSAGSVYDEVTENKAIKRVGVVDLGSLSWDYKTGTVNHYFLSAELNGLMKQPANSTTIANIICAKYPSVSYLNGIGRTDKAINGTFESGDSWIAICDTAYTDKDTFKTAMNGVMLYYELAEPIEVDIDEQNLAYPVDGGGTEQILPENTSTPTTTPARLDVNYGLDAMATLKNLQKNYLAQTDLDRLLTAEGYTYTKTWDATNNQWNFTISGNSNINNKADKVLVTNHGTSDTAYSVTPNVLHIWGEVASLTLTLATPTDATIENEYKIQFTSGSTAIQFAIQDTITWGDSCGTISLAANKIYQVSIENNLATWESWSLS